MHLVKILSIFTSHSICIIALIISNRRPSSALNRIHRTNMTMEANNLHNNITEFKNVDSKC